MFMWYKKKMEKITSPLLYHYTHHTITKPHNSSFSDPNPNPNPNPFTPPSLSLSLSPIFSSPSLFFSTILSSQPLLGLFFEFFSRLYKLSFNVEYFKITPIFGGFD